MLQEYVTGSNKQYEIMALSIGTRRNETQGQKVEFHEIEIQLFHEVKIDIFQEIEFFCKIDQEIE